MCALLACMGMWLVGLNYLLIYSLVRDMFKEVTFDDGKEIAGAEDWESTVKENRVRT